MAKLKKIPVSKLVPGMFVHDLDISWLHSPFLRHRRKLEDQKDIELLHEYGVRIVTIDLDKGCDIPAITKKTDNALNNCVSTITINDSPSHPNQGKSQQSKIETIKQKEKTALQDELLIAHELRNKIQKLVVKLFSNVKNGVTLSAQEIFPLIKESLDSVKRNDQALLTMLHMHRQDIRLDAHAFGVFSLILALGIKVNCTREELEILGLVALLHDCGWARLPLNLFAKGKAYTPAEKKLVQQHTSLAVNAIAKMDDIPADVVTLIAQHHELANGKGYPRGLLRDQLHPLHDIFQVADLYDEYIHGLEDFQGVLPANALKKLYQQSQRGCFSEKLVSHVVRLLGVYPISSVVLLNSGETAVVTEINRKLPLLPFVTIVLDKDGRELKIPEAINLAQDEKTRLIQKVIEPSSLPQHLIL